MIKIVWIIGILLTALILVVHFGFVKKKSIAERFSIPMQVSKIHKWIFRIAVFSLFILTITGANAVIFSSQPLTGLGLLIHLSFAPLFAIGFAVLIFQWVHVFQTREDKRLNFIQILFWLSTILVLPVILSIVLSMFSFFGTNAQQFLYDVHRVSSLFLVVTTALFMYFTFAKWMKNL